ncbi:MAG: FtsQ-type POTRA domain-containing protein [Gammaproteobacteria bacterium]|nr:FtsQ-type POTRA domain-containing protein [Gammaproteobacteria bacterium]
MASEWQRLGSGAVVVIPVLLAWLCWVALDRRIETVEVITELMPKESAAVSTAVHRAIDGGILSVDIDAVAQALVALSWPRSVTVRRVWPDRLQVSVVKPTLIARWNGDRYLTSTGAVVSSEKSVEDLPILECAMASPRESMEMYGLLQEISAIESLSLAELRQNRIGEWQIRFADGMTVNLGAEKVIERMHRFIAVWRDTSVTNDSAIAYVDTRYPNGVAIRLNEMLASGRPVVSH